MPLICRHMIYQRLFLNSIFGLATLNQNHKMEQQIMFLFNCIFISFICTVIQKQFIDLKKQTIIQKVLER